MAIGFQLDAKHEFTVRGAARTSALSEAPQTLDAAIPLPAPLEQVVSYEGQDWSTLNEASLSRQWRRAMLMRAPFVLGDILALALAATLAQWTMRLLYPPAAASLGHAAPFALLPLILAYGLGALYSEIWVHPVIEFRQLTHITTLGMLAAAIGGSLAWPFPLWCAAAWLPAVLLVPLCRTVARFFCVERSWWGYPTLVIGTGKAAADTARMLLEVPRSGLRPVLITDPDRQCRTSVLPVMNDPATLESILRQHGIGHAVVSLPDFTSARLSETLDHYSGIVPHLMVLSDASTLPTLWGSSRCVGRLSGIEVRNGLLLATLQGVKRCFDLAVALTALLISLPLLLVIAVGIKLTSRGPIFFGHTRIGRHGRRFKAWKFRTMHPNGDAILRDYLQRVATAQAEWTRDRKLRHDPRVTRFGALLRKLSLDELPQIWNVLRGDMSVVGPRPIVQSEVALYRDVFRLYTKVKPGITGLWQVSGRTNLSYDDRVLLDQFYIRHWSPWLDVYILAKTVVALLNRDGAY
jgi:Undecaprenyl-phosphate galactose phosphotransferase WbaP